ncbi:MAG: Prolyl-tRNA synthetase [Candidatus Jorgensenbacteria bacterium GW2011_GWA1_48_13]|uniref:Proline--tRNA ligase n=1 Tax=Candidatus Jorgensenbacteria bacterium GW2011_GWB1_50_10 TaxID=1618665 RepID=A0A0G1W8W8_9BACT|nr:MAG: Proline-tRNA ligase [Parcubacteria group bacterium GW2011_GWC1_45_9]KKU94063.1 MAG: Prolyl-tRNA synthetase [Candidatus Jorgensenbacteria bacterium GW2011_GWA1_48_13]KKW15168.1 MAG: Prolyl-tRNA synthetase [Candidatus Jorgensenbacteria bacterium GW2011_GWB1_50_10]
MRQSELFTKTLKEAPKDEVSVNAKLLTRGGFVYKNSAGVYSFLPLGWRVIEKIMNIIREEMNAIGGQELNMPALVPKEYWDKSGRWDVEIGFEVKGKKEKTPGFVLGWTHEEVLAEIASKYIASYEDLPFYAYQFQTKFRNEARAKSGLLRGREFLMKDLYSFHESEKDLFRYYEEVKKAYEKIFSRCGLKTFYTVAAGGDFTISNTHEFQVELVAGEDEIMVCRLCGFAENREVGEHKAGEHCPKCESGILDKVNAVEVGNIFPLGTKYAEAFNLKYRDKKGKSEHVVMGSYGIGLGRVMGTAVEVYHDEGGIIWPESIAPFQAHLLLIGEATPELKKAGDALYNKLVKAGVDVLYDDRGEASAGEKFADADLLGIPYRLVVSEKTTVQEKVEVKRRGEKEEKLMKVEEFIDSLK